MGTWTGRWLALSSVALVACGTIGEAEVLDTASTTTETTEPPPLDPWAEDCDGVEPWPDAENPDPFTGSGSIRGSVVASGRPGGTYVPRGTVFVTVLESYDAYDPNNIPPPLYQPKFHCADLRDGGTLDYEIHGIPPRPEVYTLLVYLDVNGDWAPGGETDGCDMVGFPAEVTVTEAGQTAEIDLDLEFSLELAGFPCD